MEVYKITNKTTGKMYIGSTSYDKETRFYNTSWGHVHSMRTGREGALYEDMKQYGLDDFVLETIEEFPEDCDRKTVYEQEDYYIKTYWDQYGEDMMYNSQRGISSFYEGCKPTEEHKKHMSMSHLNVPLSSEHKKAKTTMFYYDNKIFYGVSELTEYLNNIKNIPVSKHVINNYFYHDFISISNQKNYPDLLNIQINKITERDK